MTQLLEPIAVGVVSEFDNECPFHEEEPEDEEIENEFEGDGGTLRANMEGPSSTILYVPLKPKKLSAVTSPEDEPGNDTVDVFFGRGATRTSIAYPMGCQAHHLVPAQESLKKCKPLLKYMVKRPKKTYWERPITGVVRTNLGYNVNGLENGVFLPGKHVVDGQGNGTWVRAASVLKDVDEDDAAEPEFEPDNADSERKGAKKRPLLVGGKKLTGPNHQISNSNKKWRYVDAVTKAANGQFHDRHAAYSKRVGQCLQRIAARLDQVHQVKNQEYSCDECNKKAAKYKEDGFPTPFGLLDRLNSLSNRLSKYLVGHQGHRLVYTSKWGLAFALTKDDRKHTELDE